MSGEGYFEFTTNHSEQLFAIISDALMKFQKMEPSGTRPKEQQIPNNSQQTYTPPSQVKHPKKKLTTSFSLSSINLSECARKENICSTPSLPSNDRDPVYAMITKPKFYSKNQQFNPLPDIDAFPEDIFGVLSEKEEAEEDDQKNPEQLAIHSKFKDFKSEPVYSEVDVHDDYRSTDEAVENKPHSLTSDLEDSQAVGFLKVSNDISYVMDEEKELDLPLEQLSIHNTPDVYEAESVYAQVPDYYNDYGYNEEYVDVVEDPEYFYPPCISDTYPSNFEDFHDEGFGTYDNLPKKL